MLSPNFDRHRIRSSFVDNSKCCLGIDIGRYSCSVAVSTSELSSVRTLGSFTHTDPIIPSCAVANSSLIGHAAYIQWKGSYKNTSFLTDRTTSTPPPLSREELIQRLGKHLIGIATEEHRIIIDKVCVSVPDRFDAHDRNVIINYIRSDVRLKGIPVSMTTDSKAIISGSKRSERSVQRLWGNKTILIADIGYGAAISIAKISNREKEKSTTTELLSNVNCLLSGGGEMDSYVVNYFLKDLAKRIPNIKTDSTGLAILKPEDRITLIKTARRIREGLTGSLKQSIKIPTQYGEFSLKLSRPMMETTCRDVYKSLCSAITDGLSKAKMSHKEIDEIIIVGGCAKAPKFVACIRQLFKKANANPDIVVPTKGDEIIAEGAAQVARNGVRVPIEIPQNIGIRLKGADDFHILIHKYTSLEYDAVGGGCVSRCRVFSISGKNYFPSDIRIDILHGNSRKASDNTLLSSMILNTGTLTDPVKALCVRCTYFPGGMLKITALLQGSSSLCATAFVTPNVYNNPPKSCTQGSLPTLVADHQPLHDGFISFSAPLDSEDSALQIQRLESLKQKRAQKFNVAKQKKELASAEWTTRDNLIEECSSSFERLVNLFEQSEDRESPGWSS